MKKLSQLLENINEINDIVEMDFKDKKDFQKYQAKHKMRPTTKVNIAGKDTTVGDEMGDDSETPKAPKKTTGADIEKQADKSGKEKDDIEKDIAGDDFDDRFAGIELDDEPEDDEPKSDKPKTPTFVNDDGDVVANDFDSAIDLASNLGMSDKELDYIEKEKDVEALGDYLDGQGYSQKQSDKPVNPDVKITSADFEDAFDRAIDGQNYQDSEKFLDIVSNMENQGKFDNLSQDEKNKLSDSMQDLEDAGADLDDDRASEIQDFFFELQKNHNLFDEPKSDEPKKSPEEVSKERVQTAKDLDNSEQITNDPTGTLEKMDELLSDVMVELEDNEDADDEYFKIDDEFRYRIHQIENEFEDGEDKEQATKDLKDLASDVERFMDNDYRKVAGISKPTKFQGRNIPQAPKYDTSKKTVKKPSSLDSYYAKEDAKKKWLSSNSGKTSYDWSRLPYGTKSDLIDKEMRRKGFKENINLKELSKISTRYNK